MKGCKVPFKKEYMLIFFKKKWLKFLLEFTLVFFFFNSWCDLERGIQGKFKVITVI